MKSEKDMVPFVQVEPFFFYLEHTSLNPKAIFIEAKTRSFKHTDHLTANIRWW